MSPRLRPFLAAAALVAAAAAGVPTAAAEVPAAPSVAAAAPSVAAAAPSVAAAVVTPARPVQVVTGRVAGQPTGVDLEADAVSEAVDRASAYFSASTGGAVRLAVDGAARDAGTFAGWGDPATCETSQVFALLDWAGRAAGLDPAAGSAEHVVVRTPFLEVCGPNVFSDVDDGGVVWINEPTDAPLDPWAVVHGLGHTLGLGDSDARVSCRSLTDAPAEECVAAEGAGAYDVMGLVLPEDGTLLGTPGPLNGAQLAVLGLLDTRSAVAADAPRTVSLRAVGSLTGVRFLTFATGGATYVVEYRGAVGGDADLGSTRLGCPDGQDSCRPTVYRPGVLVYRIDGVPAPGATTHLLEAGARDPELGPPASVFTLEPGRTFTTADGAYTLTTTVRPGAAAAAVTLGTGPGSAVHVPVGNLERVQPVLGGVRVVGWSVDRDVRTSGWLWVDVAGRGRAVRADAYRADIARALPPQSTRQGIDVLLDAPPGPTRVCVTAVNSGPGADTSLGCRTVTVPGGSPLGALDGARGGATSLTVSGWALDPDTRAASYVWIDVDGVGRYAFAGRQRADLAAAFPLLGGAHSFSLTVPARAGTHRVCATAVNTGSGSHTWLGCRTATVLGASPLGNLETVRRTSATQVTVRGWALDPQTTASSYVYVQVGGRGTLLRANQDRRDIAAAFGLGAAHGFAATVSAPAGATRVCVTAIDVGAGANTPLGCRSL